MKSLKTGEAASVLGISDDAVRKLSECGKIKSYKTDGGHRRYHADSVYAYKKTIDFDFNVNKDKYKLIFVPNSEKSDSIKDRLSRFCQLVGWQYEVLRQSPDDEKEEAVIKKIIACIEKEEVSRVVFHSVESIGVDRFSCIKEISNYHDVQIVDISEIEGG